MRVRRWLWGVSVAAVVIAATNGTPATEATLALRDGRVFWRATTAPTRWTAADTWLAHAVTWHVGQAGVEWSELAIAGRGEARALKLVLARVDPRVARLGLVWGRGERPVWSIAEAGDAGLALNAGMFVDRLPWGWVVADGRERLGPGTGPLSSAVIGLRDGRVVWVDGDDISAWRGRPDVAFAFQSYPTLLTDDGRVPPALHQPGAINLTHRDARLALGLDRAGRLLVVLTRFDGSLPGLERLPFGLSVPEMAGVMGSLGARQAMLLDGGISAQLAVRDSNGQVSQWKGIRQVPLGLVVTR